MEEEEQATHHLEALVSNVRQAESASKCLEWATKRITRREGMAVMRFVVRETGPRNPAVAKWGAHGRPLERWVSATPATRELPPSCQYSVPCEALPARQMELQ